MHRLLLLLLLGCGPAPRPQPIPSTLQDVLDARASLRFDSSGERLVLSYGYLDGCRRLEEGLVAKVNGEPLEVLSRGWGMADGEVPGSVCNLPEWIVPSRPADEPVTTFELSDDTASVSAEFLAVNAPRALTPKNGSTTVHRGEVVELLWSPASDTPVPLEFVFTMSDGAVWDWRAENPAPGRIDARVQASAPYASGTLRYSGWVAPAVGRCSQPLVSCTIDQLGGGVVAGLDLVVEP